MGVRIDLKDPNFRPLTFGPGHSFTIDSQDVDVFDAAGDRVAVFDRPAVVGARITPDPEPDPEPTLRDVIDEVRAIGAGGQDVQADCCESSGPCDGFSDVAGEPDPAEIASAVAAKALDAAAAAERKASTARYVAGQAFSAASSAHSTAASARRVASNASDDAGLALAVSVAALIVALVAALLAIFL